MCAEKLLKRIECLRNEMTAVAMEKGFTSDESIMLSQELDKLLNFYESMKSQNAAEKVK
ncbi:Spo0E family sporulation regulatory protein-aspartic acid phosphatase [Lentibacillus juripiscarius]|uniref:Spo0E family sporulation regulatory protein-aspartic acid phosphatase n=1 Tax=Lentibacillus juripiscarius TaxID=257446 RepID=A0ABW5V8M6_9BACI